MRIVDSMQEDFSGLKPVWWEKIQFVPMFSHQWIQWIRHHSGIPNLFQTQAPTSESFFIYFFSGEFSKILSSPHRIYMLSLRPQGRLFSLFSLSSIVSEPIYTYISELTSNVSVKVAVINVNGRSFQIKRSLVLMKSSLQCHMQMDLCKIILLSLLSNINGKCYCHDLESSKLSSVSWLYAVNSFLVGYHSQRRDSYDINPITQIMLTSRAPSFDRIEVLYWIPFKLKRLSTLKCGSSWKVMLFQNLFMLIIIRKTFKKYHSKKLCALAILNILTLSLVCNKLI